MAMHTKNAPLLPSGLYDLLPPVAKLESDATQRLLGCFESFGYAQVSPPLLEFEASLLSGRGEALAAQTFRMMDPGSQAMMGLRSDITLQVARIAGTRLGSAPRPLRLCYAGPILQVKPDALKNERQLMQAGIELIGSASPKADVEAMIVAAEALALLGIPDISIDINLPGLLSELCPEARDDAGLRTRLKDALQRKDSDQLKHLPLAQKTLLIALIEAAGPAEKALAELTRLGIAQAGELGGIVACVKASCPQASLTLDPLEYRGFDYHQGIGFSLFAKGLRHEMGRGGRYQANGESATGFTLYVTQLLGLLTPPQAVKMILIPLTLDHKTAADLRSQGFATVIAMTDNFAKEAKNLDISHIWDRDNHKISPLHGN